MAARKARSAALPAPLEGVGTTPPGVRLPVLLAVEAIEANEYNPNEMDGGTFDELVREIREDGFDDPVKVVPMPGQEGRYRIVDGEHRWRAARVAGLREIPAVVGEWDEETQQLKTVRRNRLRGDLNAVKFTRLANALLATGRYDAQALRQALAIRTEKAWKALYLAPKEARERAAKEAVTEQQRKFRAVTDLGDVVRKLIEEYGNTIPQSYIFFQYGGQTHLMVECTAAVRQWADMVKAQAVAEGRDINAVLLEWVGGGTPPT